MPYAIVTLFGFFSGVIFSFWYIVWSLKTSQLARLVIIRNIHDYHAHEYQAYCHETCGKELSEKIFSELDRIETNAQEDSEQSQKHSKESSGSRS